MKELIFIDGKPFDRSFPLRSLFYGEGLFETFRWRTVPPVFWNKHIERMRKGAGVLEIPFPEPKYIKETVEKAVLDSNISDAYVKICLLSQGDSVFYEKASGSLLLVIVKEYQPLKEPLKAHFSYFTRNSSSPLIRLKSLNYLENILAKREVMKSGFDEAIFLNERGDITEGAASNIFWLKKGTLITPSLECGLLPGVIREVVIDIAREIGIEVSEGRFNLNDLISSQTAFFTNSLLGAVSISQVNEFKSFLNTQEFLSIQTALLNKLGWI